jgi:hypothetical protein
MIVVVTAGFSQKESERKEGLMRKRGKRGVGESRKKIG